MNTFEQLITTLATFILTDNNWDEKCHALKVLLENTQIDGYVRHRRETACLIETLYIWENATNPDNNPQVLLSSTDSTVWDVKVILDNQVITVIGLRPL